MTQAAAASAFYQQQFMSPWGVPFSIFGQPMASMWNAYGLGQNQPQVGDCGHYPVPEVEDELAGTLGHIGQVSEDDSDRESVSGVSTSGADDEMYGGQSTRLGSVARSGFAGICSIYLAFFGVFVFFTACVLIGMGSISGIEDSPHFQDDFFADSREQSRNSNNGLRVAGAILMVIALIMLCTSIGLCVYVCKKVSTSSTTNQSGQILVGGTAPPPAGHHAQTAGATSYPMGSQGPPAGYPSQPAGYPSQPTGYPSQPAGYPSQPAGYQGPPAGYQGPPAGYPPQQAGYPSQGGYPPAQPAGYPPPGAPAPGYGPAPTYPAGYPPAGTEPSAPPPPSYQDTVMNEKTGY